MKIAIIGCGAAGATAAQFARKQNRRAEITIYDNEGYGEYSKCALPLVISGELEWKDIIEYPPQWFERAGINYRHENVSRIDFDSMEVEGKDVIEYDKIIIATGAKAAIPFEVSGAYVLRDMEDAIKIRKAAMNSKKAIVIGAGLIGLEVAEALKTLGLEVLVLEYMDFVLPNMLDPDMASQLLKKLDGIEIKTGCMVKKVEGGYVETKEESYEGDVVVIATGNRASVDLCKGCEVKKGIVVDEYSKARENVYAAGDCTQIKDFFGNEMLVGLGTIAARQGRIAGINAAGGSERMLPPLASKTALLFGVEVASVGLTQNQATHYARHSANLLPEYMKGEKIVIKLMADEEGRVVGGQAIGKNASLYIDRIAYAIYNKMHVKELSWFENAYAPKVAPVFDAINVVSQALLLKMRRKNGRNI